MISRPAPVRKSGSGRKHASFHGRIPVTSDGPPPIRRVESRPELLRRLSVISGSPKSPENSSQRLTKLLLNVTIERSLGPIHVVMSSENKVEDLIKATLEAYVKEGRRPLLTETDPMGFEIHYSQFSLESLNPKEKLSNLGSRNFFLCPNRTAVDSCSNLAKKESKAPIQWPGFMEFLL